MPLDDLVDASLHPKRLRLLFLDIETAPILAYLWDLRQKYIGPEAIVEHRFMFSWAAKWSESDTLHSRVVSPTEARNKDDVRIVSDLADMVRKADYTVAHNGDRFDLPMLNTRVLRLGLDPLGETQTIDTLKLAQRSFRFESNKLDYLAQTLGFEGKHDTDFDLWRECYEGKQTALTRMVDYNRNDVVLLQKVYEVFAPHVKGLPRLVDFTEYRQDACPYCGSSKRAKDGYHRTKVNSFQRYRCECGRRYRAWQAIGSRKAGGVGL